MPKGPGPNLAGRLSGGSPPMRTKLEHVDLDGQGTRNASGAISAGNPPVFRSTPVWQVRSAGESCPTKGSLQRDRRLLLRSGRKALTASELRRRRAPGPFRSLAKRPLVCSLRLFTRSGREKLASAARNQRRKLGRKGRDRPRIQPGDRWESRSERRSDQARGIDQLARS